MGSVQASDQTGSNLPLKMLNDMSSNFQPLIDVWRDRLFSMSMGRSTAATSSAPSGNTAARVRTRPKSDAVVPQASPPRAVPSTAAAVLDRSGAGKPMQVSFGGAARGARDNRWQPRGSRIEGMGVAFDPARWHFRSDAFPKRAGDALPAQPLSSSGNGKGAAVQAQPTSRHARVGTSTPALASEEESSPGEASASDGDVPVVPVDVSRRPQAMTPDDVVAAVASENASIDRLAGPSNPWLGPAVPPRQ